jgi:hypothetical protein
VFVVAPNGSEAVVYRATDGQELGRRQIPSANERMSFLGRNILTFSTAGGKTTIRLFDPWDQRDVWEAPKFAAGAKANLWRQETLAVLEPAGRIVLLDVADGRMLADSPIEQLPSTAEVYLLGSRENWVVVTNRTGQSDVRMNNMHPIPGGASNPKIDGFACGFDRRTGKKLWETKVERQGLYLDQPSELPVLVFASHVYNVAAGSTQPSVSVHVIDKRTGKEIHKKTTAGSVANYELAADLDKKTIDLKIVRDSIRMVFSPDPPAEPEAEKKPAEKP